MLTVIKLYMVISLSTVYFSHAGGYDRQIIARNLTDRAQCEAIAEDFQKSQMFRKVYCVEVAE